MRTHELANFLKGLSEVLADLPDMEIMSLPKVVKKSLSQSVSLTSVEAARPMTRKNVSNTDIQKTLATLSKREILEILEKANITVSIRTKDSGKDVAKKIAAYLKIHPAAARQFGLVLEKQRPTLISQPLSKALETLLGG